MLSCFYYTRRREKVKRFFLMFSIYLHFAKPWVFPLSRPSFPCVPCGGWRALPRPHSFRALRGMEGAYCRRLPFRALRGIPLCAYLFGLPPGPTFCLTTKSSKKRSREGKRSFPSLDSLIPSIREILLTYFAYTPAAQILSANPSARVR